MILGSMNYWGSTVAARVVGIFNSINRVTGKELSQAVIVAKVAGMRHLLVGTNCRHMPYGKGQDQWQEPEPTVGIEFAYSIWAISVHWHVAWAGCRNMHCSDWSWGRQCAGVQLHGLAVGKRGLVHWQESEITSGLQTTAGIIHMHSHIHQGWLLEWIPWLGMVAQLGAALVGVESGKARLRLL